MKSYLESLLYYPEVFPAHTLNHFNLFLRKNSKQSVIVFQKMPPVSKHLTFYNGQKMPSIGLGTSAIVNEDELEQALTLAVETGYRHIDTAYFYQNEALIGKVLRNIIQSGKVARKDMFITTKLPGIGVHPDRVELFINRSLANLQLDYVDLYLIHTPKALQYDPVTGGRRINEKGEAIPETDVDLVAVWKKMEEQVDKGRAKSIGLSNFNIKQIEEILKNCRIKPANLQVEMNVFLQQPELREFCKRNGITIVAYGPLGAPNYNERRRKRLGPNVPTVKLPDMLGNPVINQIAKKHSKTPAQVLLRFLLEIGVAPIPKSVTPNRIKENFDVYSFSLDENDMKKLINLDVGEAARIFQRD